MSAAGRQPRYSGRTVVHQPKDASEVWRPQDADGARTGPAAMPAVGRRESPRERGRKGNQMLKPVLGAGVLIADIITGMASPQILAGLHKPHPHLTGPVVLYAVLALLTLWVVMSVARRRPAAAAPAQRRPGYPFGGPR